MWPGSAADVALIAFDAAEPAEDGREGVVDPAVERIDLTVAAVLVDDGAVLRQGRTEVVGIGTKSDRRRQPVELLAQRDVAGHQIVRRRRDGIGRRTQRADALVQMRDLEVREDGEVVGDVEPGIALEAGIGLVEAGILIIDG